VDMAVAVDMAAGEGRDRLSGSAVRAREEHKCRAAGERRDACGDEEQRARMLKNGEGKVLKRSQG